jgi:hypothetical protein
LSIDLPGAFARELSVRSLGPIEAVVMQTAANHPERQGSKLTLAQHLVLALILVGALGLRLAYLAGQARNNPIFGYPVMDAGQHHEWAQRIASGQGMGDQVYFRAPLYYYLLGVLYKLFGVDVGLGRAAGCVLGAVSCYLTARLGAALGGLRVGVLAGIIAAVYWPFIYFDAELLSVGLEIFLNMALLLLLVRAAQRRSLALFLFSGVVWGLSAIARPTVLAIAPALLAWPWIATPRGQRALPKLWAGVLTLVGAALAVLPVTLRNYLVGGELVLISSNGGITYYHGNNPGADGVSARAPGLRRSRNEALIDMRRIPESELGRELSAREVSAYWYGKAFEWIRSEPGAWARLMFFKLLVFWSPFEIPNNQPIWCAARLSGVSVIFWIGFPVIACLGIAGMVCVRGQWRAWFLPASFLVIYMATVVAFYCNARYRLPVAPVLILFAAACISRVVKLVGLRSFRPLGGYLLIIAVLALMLRPNPAAREGFGMVSETTWHMILGDYYWKPLPLGPGDLAKSVEHLRDAVRLAPTSARARLMLGRGLMRLNDVAGAEREFALVVEEHPQHAEARFEYARVLAAAHKYNDAVEQLEAATGLQPSYAEAHECLGCLLADMGCRADAIEHLRAALAIQPDLVRARVRLKELTSGARTP